MRWVWGICHRKDQFYCSWNVSHVTGNCHYIMLPPSHQANEAEQLSEIQGGLRPFVLIILLTRDFTWDSEDTNDCFNLCEPSFLRSFEYRKFDTWCRFTNRDQLNQHWESGMDKQSHSRKTLICNYAFMSSLQLWQFLTPEEMAVVMYGSCWIHLCRTHVK